MGNTNTWPAAFGKHKISKGQSNEWKFKIFRKTGDMKPAIFIGIAENDKLLTKCNRIFAQGSARKGYAYYAHNGTKYNYKNDTAGKKYGVVGRNEDIIEMKLDMTQKEHKNGLLSFKINGRDH